MKTFRSALQGHGFPLTAELSIDRHTTLDEALRQAALLAGSVDAIQVADNLQSGVQIAPLALADSLLRRGIDPIPTLTCRDRNRIALQSDLLGLRALGVTSLVLIKGSTLAEKDSALAKPVFDLTCPELVAMAQAMNEEEWRDSRHEFVIGTGATVFAPETGWNAEYLQARARAGARFLMTQPCFNLALLHRYLDGLVHARMTWNYSVIVTLAPLSSAEQARRLADSSRGALIPDEVIDRLENSADPEREGIEICAGLMQEIRRIPGVTGINLLALGNPEAVVSAIGQSGMKSTTEEQGIL